MRYELAVNSAGGNDVALAKSFIIACEGPVLNWYFFAKAAFSLQLGRPQDKIHASISDVR
jgi:hypothetical protein